MATIRNLVSLQLEATKVGHGKNEMNIEKAVKLCPHAMKRC